MDAYSLRCEIVCGYATGVALGAVYDHADLVYLHPAAVTQSVDRAGVDLHPVIDHERRIDGHFDGVRFGA